MASVSHGALIRLENVALRVPTFLQHQTDRDSWTRMLLGAAIDRPERRLHTILEAISFEVTEGERVALIGRNGAGKTSLLHLLTGCYVPTDGQIEVRGSRQALLNVTLGFNFEATVRENIFLRGVAMGIPIDTIRSSVGSILEFSGLGHFSAQKLGTLSAGQRMRLGFAISTNVQPDIMLLDEWIGAGDAEFLQRARERMQDRVTGSRIMVLASHSTDLLKRVCTRGLVLDKGGLVFDAPIKEALAFYSEMVRPATQAPGATAAQDAPAAFARKRATFASRYGIQFTYPVHCLFENRRRGDDGRDEYGLLVEVESVSLTDAMAEVAAQLTALGFGMTGYKGSGLPNEFLFSNGKGSTASVLLKVYGAKDPRQAPGAAGRLHLRMAGPAAG